MSEEIKFEIGNKAEQLLFSVFDITTNRNHYIVRFRRLFVVWMNISKTT